MHVVGVDGCRQGWVVVRIGPEGALDAGCFARFDEVMRAHSDAAVVGVDMPLGLVDAGPREADRAARAFLTGQTSSIFSAPPRSALAARDYREAVVFSEAATGKGLSRQSFALFEKIREVDRFVADPRVMEVHPEVAFRCMSGGEPVGRKKSYGGMRRRLALLEAQGVALPESLGPADAIGIDDVIDAAAVAWTARRIARGEALRLPADDLQRDASGRSIAIWG